MPILLQLKNAHKSFGDQVILEGAEVALTDSHKVGLIGRNGSGKTTLCRILLDDEGLEEGDIARHPELRVGYLTQHDPFEEDESVLAFLLRDSGQPDWRCGEMAGQFELKGPLLERPIRELSGGWQTRVKLTALLLHEPNLLILDEPTNFLDLRTQLLLERFLKTFRGACLVVSHDRTFLKDTCTETLELARGKLTFFPGNVDAYLEHRQMQREHDERVNATIAAKRRQLETFIEKNRAHPDTASQARSKAKQLEKLQLIEIEAAESTVRMRVPEVEKKHGSALRCLSLNIGYPEHQVASDIELEIDHGARVAVVGDNGEGKTTFLRTVTDSLPSLSGSFRWGHGCDVGCYAQHVYSSLPQHYTVHEYLGSCAAPGTTGQTVLNIAGSFLFSGADVEKSVSVLSGGERARLCLAGLLLGRHNILVLDEPINHLDVETVDVFVEALKRYQGTVIFTSHDRHFLDRIATGIIEVRDRRVVNYPGSYQDYLYRVNKEIGEGDRDTGKSAKKPDKKEMTRAERKAFNRQKFDLECEIKSVERRTNRLDTRKKEIDETLPTLINPNKAQKLCDERDVVVEKLEALETQWFELQEKMEKLMARLDS